MIPKFAQSLEKFNQDGLDYIIQFLKAHNNILDLRDCSVRIFLNYHLKTPYMRYLAGLRLKDNKLEYMPAVSDREKTDPLYTCFDETLDVWFNDDRYWHKFDDTDVYIAPTLFMVLHYIEHLK